MSDVLGVVLAAIAILLAVLVGSLLFQRASSPGIDEPAFGQGQFRIVECEDSSPSALGGRALSSYTTEELQQLPRVKKQECRVIVGTSVTRESVQETVQTIIRDKTKSDPDLDVITLFLYSTEDRISNAWDVASALWSPDGTSYTTSAEVARSNDRTGYVTKVEVRHDLETYLAAIRTDESIYGLDESTRRAIFTAITVCEDAAHWEACKRYDSYCTRCREFITNDRALFFAYVDTYETGCKGKLTRRYHISGDALEAISLEGLEKSWPLSTPISSPTCCE